MSVASVSAVVLLSAPGELNRTSTIPAYYNSASAAVTSARDAADLVRSTGVAHELAAAAEHGPSHVLAYSFIVFGVLAFLATVAFVVFCIFRRNKLDRIRHHLMPMYNFDAATEEEARWEADLIEDDREQQIALNSVANRPPKLKFHSHGLEI